MLSLSNFEKFREDYYKNRWPGLRLGQAFMFHSGVKLRPNPILFYDPNNARAEDYIRRHYVPQVVNTWKWVINDRFINSWKLSSCPPNTSKPETEVMEIQLLMSESLHQLLNVTTGDYGSSMPHNKAIQVSAYEHSAFFMYSNHAPCSGDLLYCEVVE